MKRMNSHKRKIKRESYLSFLKSAFLFIILSHLEAINDTINLFYYNSEIYLVIKGNGTQKLLNNSFKFEPSEVLVNGNKDDSCRKTCDLTGDKNNITLIHEDQITYCTNMFRELTNVIEVDLSNFDTSKVTHMHAMFHMCSNIEKITLGKLNTSSVKDMQSLFSNCNKLISLDLSYFDTSKVTNMNYTFSGCSSLSSIDISNLIF